MLDRFVPLCELLVRTVGKETQTEHVEPVVVPLADEPQVRLEEAAAQMRRFRAAVRDAVDVAVERLLCNVAAEVLARELELAPVNVTAIVERACAQYENDGVLSVRVHPDEVAQIPEEGISVVADAGLRRGDVLLQVRSGTIDVSLGARLANVLKGLEP